MSEWRSSPFLSPDPLAGKSRLLLRRRRIGSWERYEVGEPEGGGLLLTVTRYGRFWRNLLAGVAGVVSGLAFAAFFFLRALAAEKDSTQVALALLSILGGVVVIFLVDILLSPPRDIRAHIPGGDRRSFFRFLEARKINLHGTSFTLYDPERKVRATVRKDSLLGGPLKRWTCLVPVEGALPLVLVEDSVLRSVLHRLLGGAFGLFATDYLFLREGREVGRLHRKGPYRNRFLLALDPETTPAIDPSLAVALAVLADSIEWR